MNVNKNSHSSSHSESQIVHYTTLPLMGTVCEENRNLTNSEQFKSKG